MGAEDFAGGMVLCNHLGEFIKARSFWQVGKITSFEAEAQGVPEALKWIQLLNVTDVEVECDAMLVVQAIHRGVANLLEVGTIL